MPNSAALDTNTYLPSALKIEPSGLSKAIRRWISFPCFGYGGKAVGSAPRATPKTAVASARQTDLVRCFILTIKERRIGHSGYLSAPVLPDDSQRSLRHGRFTVRYPESG